MLKDPKQLWSLRESTFIIFFLHSEGRMICKKSAFFKFEIIRVFVNTFTVDAKYPEPDCENFPFPMQMQLF